MKNRPGALRRACFSQPDYLADAVEARSGIRFAAASSPVFSGRMSFNVINLSVCSEQSA